MMITQRQTPVANLDRATCETWPARGEQAGTLDLRIIQRLPAGVGRPPPDAITKRDTIAGRTRCG